MTVNDCLVNFRGALRSLLPFAERAAVTWRQEDAYDVWDEIAASVFRGLVQEPLRWEMPESERERFELPPYDLLLEQYTTPTSLELEINDRAGRRIFNALRTQREPFDLCECRVVDEVGVPTSAELEWHPLESVRFLLRHRMEDGRILRLDGRCGT